MDPRRVFGRTDGAADLDRDLDRDTVAARRLALIAADLGRGDPVPRRHGDDTEQPWWAGHTHVAPGNETGDTAHDDGAHDGALAPVVPLPVHADPMPEPIAPPSGPALPMPGRHAARRPVGRLAPLLRHRPPSLTPAHLAVVALVVALALAVTTWWVIRDRPDPLPAERPMAGEPVAPLVSTTAEAGAPDAGAPEAGASDASGAAGTGEQVTVDVAGKVRHPGIVVLDAGARVTDALEAAGGVRRGVDTTALNLARVLIDGEQIVVGAPAGAAPAGPASAPPGGAAPTTLVNLNTATQAELETLPQVGPVTAQSIVAWRDQNGGFTSIDELLEIDGIGEKTLARLTPYVTV